MAKQVTPAADYLDAEATGLLLAVLGRAQKLGFIGKGSDLDFEIAHSVRFGRAAVEYFGEFGGRRLAGGHEEAARIGAQQVNCFDIGSGGGLPALAVALGWVGTHWTLCEISAKRCDFLEWAIRRLKLDARVDVVEGSVDELAGDGAHAEKYKIVTARAFGPISRVLGVAAGLLVQGGLLLVSDPPDAQQTAVARESEMEPRLEACGSHEGISVFMK